MGCAFSFGVSGLAVRSQFGKQTPAVEDRSQHHDTESALVQLVLLLAGRNEIRPLCDLPTRPCNKERVYL